MTGAGSAEVAARLEDGYLTPDTEGEWFQPGKDISVGDLSIDNQLTRNRDPDDATPDGSREGNFVGTASVSFTMTDDKWHDLLPFENGSLSQQGGLAPSAEWYFGVQALDDDLAEINESITAAGASVINAEVQYQEGQDVSVDLTIEFGDLSDSAPAAGEIVQPSSEDVYTHHGTDLSVGGVDQSAMQSATLSLANLARRQEQQARTPRAMVVGAIEPELTTDAIFSGPDQLELAVGGTTNSVGDMIEGEETGSLTFENGLGETIEYTLSKLQPIDYSFTALVEPDTDLTEPVTYHVANVEV